MFRVEGTSLVDPLKCMYNLQNDPCKVGLATTEKFRLKEEERQEGLTHKGCIISILQAGTNPIEMCLPL
jgi:hypothetical protein